MFSLTIDSNHFLSWNKKYTIYSFWMHRQLKEKSVNEDMDNLKNS